MTTISATTTEWIGIDNGLWNDPDNWTNGVPRQGITTVIDTGNSEDFNIDLGGGSYQISGIQITGNGNVTLSDGSVGVYIQTVQLAQNSKLTLNNATVDAIYQITDTGTIGAVTGGTIAITNGSSLKANYITSNITFSGPKNEIYQFWSGYTIPTMTNISPDDYILFSANEWAGVYWNQNADGSYRIVDTSDNVLVASMRFAPGSSPSDFRWIRPYGAGYSGLVCFLPGTMIRTPHGEVRVEDLAVGDKVVTLTENGIDCSPVSWIGKAHAKTDPHASSDDMSGAPVRILKDAISQGVPFKDLLITPEHCLFIGGKFMPARMLVNNTTIFYDKSFSDYDYYHVETARHSVLVSDGLATESYLDTGNRKTFVGTESCETKNLKWGEDSYAELNTSPEFVTPIFQAIADRGRILSSGNVSEMAATTDTPMLRLITDSGKMIFPLRKSGQSYLFMIPDNTSEIQITSNTSRPSDVIGPFVDDRRNLGVAVGRISIISAAGHTPVTTHLEARDAQGWHEVEGDARWTNGRGKVTLPEAVPSLGQKMISIEIKKAGPYLKATSYKKAA
ncbi:Hint domain-containing protein [Acetobacter persici]|uniref:Hedgehog/Intein (Hint) domain-containing protein n=1 Tax=Acetobacter persici TaxID=1076596 RepID=A0A1U9LJ42_9PROT|nr:Hint domain-containing protein [Acetobacter persici]AQT06418.1 hypothetical protein A0U91_15505 [Acetobacter persici]